MGALLERARQIGSISATQYKYMRMNFSKVGYHIQEPPELPIQIESPTLMKDLISLHLNELRFSLREFAVLLRMTESECAKAYVPQSGLQLVAGLRMA
jgi:hypothetical protein